MKWMLGRYVVPGGCELLDLHLYLATNYLLEFMFGLGGVIYFPDSVLLIFVWMCRKRRECDLSAKKEFIYNYSST